jgi:hypothetical protein
MKKGSCYITDEFGIMYPVSKTDKEYLLAAFEMYCVGEHPYSKQWIIDKLRKYKEKLPLIVEKDIDDDIILVNVGPGPLIKGKIKI